MESSSTACASSEAVPHAESAKDPAAEPTDGEVHLAIAEYSSKGLT